LLAASVQDFGEANKNLRVFLRIRPQIDAEIQLRLIATGGRWPPHDGHLRQFP
jgi:hypothetical protein